VENGEDEGRNVSKLLPQGFVACPSCNHSNKIELVGVITEFDKTVDPNGGLPNAYVVSILKCKCCNEIFKLERVDVRFGGE